MAAMTLALTEFADNGNSRTFTIAGHSVQKPYLLIQSRNVPTNGQSVATNTFRVIRGTTNAEGLPIEARVRATVETGVPVDHDVADQAQVLADLRDLVNSDEFGAAFTTQNYVK